MNLCRVHFHNLVDRVFQHPAAPGLSSIASPMAARRGFLRGGALLLAGAGGFAVITTTAESLSDNAPPRWIHDRVPPRQEQLRRLSEGTAANPYDVLIIGGRVERMAAAVREMTTAAGGGRGSGGGGWRAQNRQTPTSRQSANFHSS